MTTPLQKAAKAVITDWDNSIYLEGAIAELRKALDAEIAQSVEPLAWIERDMRCDDFDPDSVTCLRPVIAADGWEWLPLYLHPTQPQASMSEEWTDWQAEGESLIEGKNNGVLFALGEWWADRPWRTKP